MATQETSERAGHAVTLRWAAVPAPAIVFDLDGTVWDSAPGILHSLEATLTELGLPVPPRAELAVHLGPPLLSMLADLGVADGDLDHGRVVYRRHYRQVGELECTVFDGIPELLDGLRSAGHPLATATSKGVEPTERMLRHFGLYERFDVVAAASMTAAGHTKEQIVGEALHRLGQASGAMVGDRVYDVEGGRHHGLVTIGVAWGYAPDGELESAGVDHLVATVSELAAVLAALGADA